MTNQKQSNSKASGRELNPNNLKSKMADSANRSKQNSEKRSKADGSSDANLESLKCVYTNADSLVKLGVYVEEESYGGVQKRATSHPLRIHVEYAEDVDLLSQEQRSLIKKTLLPDAVRYLSKILNVKQAVSPIRLHRGCAGEHYYKLHNDPHEYCAEDCSPHTLCGPVIVPSSHLKKCYFCENESNCNSKGADGAGVANTDFILYVTAADTHDCNVEDTIAHAAHCQQEIVLDRPIAGYINMCPHGLVVSQKSMLLTTVEHEIIHALGFSAALYAFYRDVNGNPLTARDPSGLPPLDSVTSMYNWSENVVKTVIRQDWSVRGGPVAHKVHLMVTPKVVEEAANHFNCPSLEGLELENQGGYGTEITHFEKRILENEAMTGTHTHDRIVSRLTLAVLEDTGWYEPDYGMADPLFWGKGLGCDFATKSCKYWMDTQKIRKTPIWPYCDKIRQDPFNLSCNVGRSSVALCNLFMRSKPLPAEYQYFDSLPGVSRSNIAKYGGSSELSDYCPYFQQFNYDGSAKSSECLLAHNIPGEKENVAAEYYGEGSKCFHHGVAWRQLQCKKYWTQNVWGAGCHKYQCSSKGLAISVLDTSYPCSHAGQVIEVYIASNTYVHMGELICPPCVELCGQQCPFDKEPPAYSTDKVDIPCPAGNSRSLPSSKVIIFLLLLLIFVQFLLTNL
ncbi:leishmanolysin-like peptidase [Amphiura filiformis]|uniref:leishmanolysin-like peptidase n=1 Tax=Amphiura filiformis TaxID=82378 RepID=UPI003B21CAD1